MSKAVVASGALVLAAALSWVPAFGQVGVNVQVALDKPVDLNISELAIGQVFQRLTDATGVRFVIGQDVYACLPYGDQTRLVVNLKNVTLRNALSPMLTPLGMEWIIEDNAVRIVPTAPLARMTRRAAYEELLALGRILSVKLQPIDRGGAVLDQLRTAAGNKELKVAFPTKVEQADREAAFIRADRALPCTGAQWLDMLCQGRGWTWYLTGDDVTIIEQKAQIERQLRQQVSLRYKGADLTAVMLDLAHKARVLLNMDPGVMDYVPVETRKNFNLIMSEATIAQALEVISGATGLQFVTENDGIRVEASEKLKKTLEAVAGASAKRSPFFLKTAIPLGNGATLEAYIRAEDLPAEVQTIINAEKAKLVEALCKKYDITMTQPASQPAP
jgi:hypothetical protein